jgi:hypothetical protein
VRVEFGKHRMRLLPSAGEYSGGAMSSASHSTASGSHAISRIASNDTLVDMRVEEAELLELEQAILHELLATDDEVAEYERYERLEREAQAEADALGEEFAMFGLDDEGEGNADASKACDGFATPYSSGVGVGASAACVSASVSAGSIAEPSILCPQCKLPNVQWSFHGFTCPCGLNIRTAVVDETKTMRNKPDERTARQEFVTRVRQATGEHSTSYCSAEPCLSLSQSALSGTVVLLLSCDECGHHQVV